MFKLIKNYRQSVCALLVLPVLTMIGTPAQAVDFEVYTGVSTGAEDLHYGPNPATSTLNNQDVDAGWLIGVGGYVSLPNVPALELGLDVMYLDQDYSTWGGPGTNLTTTSIMGNVRYSASFSPTTEYYFGGGLGMIDIEYEEPSSPFLNGSEWETGWQLETGVRYGPVGPIPAIFSGLKYQEAFDFAFIQNEFVEYKSLSLIAGVRF